MSNILKLLQDDLKQENYSGITYETIGARAGISKAHVGKLINDPPNERLAKLALGKALLLFPKLQKAYEVQYARNASQANISSPQAISAGGNVEVHNNHCNDSAKLERLASFVLASSLPDEEKVAAMKLLH